MSFFSGFFAIVYLLDYSVSTDLVAQILLVLLSRSPQQLQSEDEMAVAQEQRPKHERERPHHPDLEDRIG